jgi:predicted DNA-binding transcriptional regulator AlpA
MVVPKQQLIGIAGVETITGKERSTIRRWYRSERFPKPRYYGTRRMWLLAEVEAWIENAGRATPEGAQS